MDINLKKMKKLFIISVSIFVPLLVSLVIAKIVKPDLSEKFTIVLLSCILLFFFITICVGMGYMMNKFNKYQSSVISNNMDILKATFGEEVEYQAKGSLSFRQIAQDPTMSAKRANTCSNHHMLTGSYRNIRFVATNIETREYTGKDEPNYVVFDGYYILFNTNVTRRNHIQRGSESNCKYDFSIFYYDNGNIGMAIPAFKSFNFIKLDRDVQILRDIIAEDCKQITMFLEIGVNHIDKKLRR